MGEQLYENFLNGLDVKKVHIVGHSLGAQMAGYMGRTVLILSNGTITISR